MIMSSTKALMDFILLSFIRVEDYYDRSRDCFRTLISFAICTSTFSKLCINVYSGM
jgi:hypothetical protein